MKDGAPRREDLVEVGRFRDRMSGEVAMGTLEAAGIEALLLVDDAGGAFGGQVLSGSARVMVREEDAEKARGMLTPEG